MTRQETGVIMDILTTAYPRFYAGPDAPDMRKTISLWAEMFAHDDVALVAAAIKSVIEGDEKGFPPTIGQVKGKLRLLTRAKEMTEAEAWEMVSSAVRNGLYGAAEEFEKFPPLVRRIVGSPNTLREWARMDTDTVHSVVASNFQRSYRTISQREREIKALPAEVRAFVEKLNPPEEETLPEVPQKTLTEPQAAEPPPCWAKEATVKGPQRSREEVLEYLRGGNLMASNFHLKDCFVESRKQPCGKGRGTRAIESYLIRACPEYEEECHG